MTCLFFYSRVDCKRVPYGDRLFLVIDFDFSNGLLLSSSSKLVKKTGRGGAGELIKNKNERDLMSIV